MAVWIDVGKFSNSWLTIQAVRVEQVFLLSCLVAVLQGNQQIIESESNSFHFMRSNWLSILDFQFQTRLLWDCSELRLSLHLWHGFFNFSWREPRWLNGNVRLEVDVLWVCDCNFVAVVTQIWKVNLRVKLFTFTVKSSRFFFFFFDELQI